MNISTPRPGLRRAFLLFVMLSTLCVGCGRASLVNNAVLLSSRVDVANGPPEDPSAYRGLRFTPTVEFRVLVDGARVPWLQFEGGRVTNATKTSGGPFYGRLEVSDSQRKMYWFTRVVGPLAPPTPGTLPLGSDEPLDGSEEIVLDVLVQPTVPPGATLVENCSDPELVVLKNRTGDRSVMAAWRFERDTGEIKEVEPKGLTCSDR